jgi:hypothetical protein
MVKRKRTREEIEEALRDNARVNSTPAEVEEPAAKNRRRARRRANQSRLSKAFEAIQLAAEQGITDTTTATDEAGRETVRRDSLAPETPAPSTDLIIQQRRERATELRRQRRQALSASQKQRIRDRDAERARSRRARQQQSIQSENRRVEMHLHDAVALEADRIRHAVLRAAQTTQEVNALRENDRIRHEDARASRSADDREADRERERARRRNVRRGVALCNHEDFDASMVSGPDIVNSRHRLPPTTVCEHCIAWKWPGETQM